MTSAGCWRWERAAWLQARLDHTFRQTWGAWRSIGASLLASHDDLAVGAGHGSARLREEGEQSIQLEENLLP